MRNMLALAASVAIAVAAVGYYRGWYSIATTQGPQGHERVSVDINAPQVTQDVIKAEQEAAEFLKKKGQGLPGVTNTTQGFTQVSAPVQGQVQAPQQQLPGYGQVSVQNPQVQVPPAYGQPPVPPPGAPYANTDVNFPAPANPDMPRHHRNQPSQQTQFPTQQQPYQPQPAPQYAPPQYPPQQFQPQQ